VQTCTFEAEGELDEAVFDAWLEGLLWNDVQRQSAAREGRPVSEHEVLRMKGVLALRGHAARHIVQAVRQLYDKVSAAAWGQCGVSAAVWQWVLLGGRQKKKKGGFGGVGGE